MRRAWFNRLRRLGSREGLQVAEAVVCLALARLAVRALPFRLLAPRLGRAHAETAATAPAHSSTRQVAWAIGAAAKRTPWRSACLEQAIAAKAMLRRRRTGSTLYLGVARAPVAPHAWLRVGTLNVTGGQDVAQYAVVASFADPEQP